MKGSRIDPDHEQSASSMYGMLADYQTKFSREVALLYCTERSVSYFTYSLFDNSDLKVINMPSTVGTI